MNGIVIALVAQFLSGLSLLIDKAMLKERSDNKVITYIFWIGFFNVLGVLLTPFGFHLPTLKVGLIALSAGAFFLAGLYCYYQAIERGEASQTIAVLGGFDPLATLLLSLLILHQPLTTIQEVAFAFLTIGGLIMFISDRVRFKDTFPWILGSAFFMGLVTVLQKYAFTGSNFVTGFALLKIGAFLTALLLLLNPKWRKQIFSGTQTAQTDQRALYLGNRAIAGVGSVLISYAISLTHPALVDATGGFRYVVVFLGAFFITLIAPKILKENFRPWTFMGKLIATLFVILGILVLGLYYRYQDQPLPAHPNWGVTFSEEMSKNFGLDWQANYTAIIHDLHPAGLRLIAYWDSVEPTSNNFQFADMDWQMQQARDANIPVILAVGEKTPRWPECHNPTWEKALAANDQQSALEQYVTTVVNRYKDYSNLQYWQIENEPYIKFGVCPLAETSFLKQEIALVHKLDPSHPVLETDGGEWGNWIIPANLGDVFGTTLYRNIYSKSAGKTHPPFTPDYYYFKALLIQSIVKHLKAPVFVSELGLEPWGPKQIYQMTIPEQQYYTSPADFQDIVDYARQSHFQTYYMWGAEWWYFMKVHNIPVYWDMAKATIANQPLPKE